MISHENLMKLIYKNKYITYSHEKQGFIMEK